MNCHRTSKYNSLTRTIALATLVMMLSVSSGCSLFVMAGKTLFGDPKVKSLFSQRTKINLSKDEKTVVVLCTIPEHLRATYSAVDRDIVDHIRRRFKIHDVLMVSANDVDEWLSRNGGYWDSPSDIARDFKTADYIIHIDLESLSYKEENSPNMYRGRSLGNVYVYEAREVDNVRSAFLIFQHEHNSTYPRNYPISADNTSERTFQERYITRIADELARMFYDHHAGDDVY